MPDDNNPSPILPQVDSLPTDDNETPTFNAPWQARAFALAVVLSDRDEYSWPDFQHRLVEEIQRDGDSVGVDLENVYYEQWLRALERLLVEDGIISNEELNELIKEFERGDRDASEFIIGEHGHSHDHNHHH